MKNVMPHEGVLHVVKRLNNSVYGNPRYLVYLLDYNSSDKRVLATGWSAKLCGKCCKRETDTSLVGGMPCTCLTLQRNVLSAAPACIVCIAW